MREPVIARIQEIERCLGRIYGPEMASVVSVRVWGLLRQYEGRIPKPLAAGLTERDVILISYPDQLHEPDKAALVSLSEFSAKHLSGVISGIHLLPFFPSSSDDGFSVIDYREVAAEYGTWEDVRRLAGAFRLMFDAVINHASAESSWFQGFLGDEAPYRDFFIKIDGTPDLSNVARPRATPLLTRFATRHGDQAIWTTFGPDQVDLNYHNPDVLLQMLDVLLLYVSQGATFIRLDAVAYLWKEIGTKCIHLPETHLLVQLVRAMLNVVAPHVMLITETNVPQPENMSYFGDGTNEASLVYNFPLPPLLLHAIGTGDASRLASWAAGLELPSDKVTFLNFLASHDGIGLDPARGILSESDIDDMAASITAGAGLVSNKTRAGGGISTYELNVNYLDAVDAVGGRQAPDLSVERFVTAHAILFSLIGVPAIYFHSLFGSRGWPGGVALSGRNRSINREKLERRALEKELADSSSRRARIFGKLSRLLAVRAREPAFAPNAEQRVPENQGSVLALLRGDSSMERRILCLHNLGPEPRAVRLDECGAGIERRPELEDLITGARLDGIAGSVWLKPYQSLWLVV